MKVILATELRNADVANLKKLCETGVDLVASRQRIENGTRVSEFLLDIELGVRIVCILEVSVRIDDLVALDSVLDRSSLYFWGTDRGRRTHPRNPRQKR